MGTTLHTRRLPKALSCLVSWGLGLLSLPWCLAQSWLHGAPLWVGGEQRGREGYLLGESGWGGTGSGLLWAFL